MQAEVSYTLTDGVGVTGGALPSITVYKKGEQITIPNAGAFQTVVVEDVIETKEGDHLRVNLKLKSL
jgi:hypothetical protein